jgi:predicted RNase H-like HicB family nuclease/DNA-binding XRE family transcriptional regulator
VIRYAVKYTADETGGFLATVPAFGHSGVTQGETLDEAREMASDLVTCLLVSYVLDHNRDAPECPAKLPSGKNWEWVYPEAKTTVAIAIRTRRRKLGLSMDQAAALVGVAKGTYQRWENPEKCNAKIDSLAKLAKAFDQQLVLDEQLVPAFV